MNYEKTEAVSTGGGKYALKVLLCLAYTIACTVAERTLVPDDGRIPAGLIVTSIVVAPLVICALMFALWWARADEFQKLIEYRACSVGAISGVAFLVGMKLASYFLPAVEHIPSLSIIGLVLLYWVSRSHQLNAKALTP